jgi:cytosine deaminase
MSELFLRGARMPGAAEVDIAIRHGCIAAIDSTTGRLPVPAGVQVIEAAGCLVLPGLVDGHCHIDKSLWGTPWHAHRAGPTLQDKILNERAVLRELGLSPQTQSARLLQHMVACGTTHARTHVDVGPDMGLSHLHGVMATREQWRDRIDIQLVAFPQQGVAVRPGTLELLEQAVREGAEVIGGLDPIGMDHDPKLQLDGIFAIAGRLGCGIDIHLHDRGDMGALTIEMIAERCAALGLRGKVAISHAFCLGMLEPGRLDEIIRLLLDQDIAVMTHAPSGPTPFPPVRLLHERGVRLFTGSDGVRDAWSPAEQRRHAGARLPDCLPLRVPRRRRHRAGAGHGHPRWRARDGYGRVWPARVRRPTWSLVAAETPAEAVVMHTPRRWVIKRGKVVARDGH